MADHPQVQFVLCKVASGSGPGFVLHCPLRLCRCVGALAYSTRLGCWLQGTSQGPVRREIMYRACCRERGKVGKKERRPTSKTMGVMLLYTLPMQGWNSLVGISTLRQAGDSKVTSRSSVFLHVTKSQPSRLKAVAMTAPCPCSRYHTHLSNRCKPRSIWV